MSRPVTATSMILVRVLMVFRLLECSVPWWSSAGPNPYGHVAFPWTGNRERTGQVNVGPLFVLCPRAPSAWPRQTPVLVQKRYRQRLASSISLRLADASYLSFAFTVETGDADPASCER